MNIEKIDDTNVILTVPRNILDIHKTFECGQCFRWDMLRTGAYSGIIKDSLIIINYTDGGYTVYKSDGNFDNMARYFDLETDYSELSKIELTEFERNAIKYGEGIRILKQDIWETVVSFIISQRNNIPKIKTTVAKMSKYYGDPLIAKYNDNPISYSAFPTPKQLVDAGIDGLEKVGLGYRAEYVYLIAKQFYENPEKFEQLDSPDVSGQVICNELLKYKGIGQKVANCIALFGYHKLDMFPIDIWIQRVIDTEYDGNINISKFGSLAGLMQQYMFIYKKGGI